MSKEQLKCALCGGKITGYGNNGKPLVDGMVCDECNLKVIEARIAQSNVKVYLEGVEMGKKIAKEIL